MNRLKPLAKTILALLIASQPVAAQQTTDTPIIQLDFTTYTADNPTPEDLATLRTDGSYEPVTFRPYLRSFEQTYRGPNPITFFRISKNPEGLEVATPAGNALIPEGTRKALLIFTQNAENHTYTVHVMNDDLSAFREGQVIFFNATNATLEGIFGKSPIKLLPGLSQPFDVKDYYEDTLFIGLAINFQGEPRRVLQNRWRFASGNRDLFILLPPEQKGSFRLRAIRLNELLTE